MEEETDPVDQGSADERVSFAADLTDRLKGYSARDLARRERVYYGRTVVNEIKSGRRLPDMDQLEVLLTEVGVPSAERAVWANRLGRLVPVEPVRPASPPPSSSPDATPGAGGTAGTSSAPGRGRPGRGSVALAVTVFVIVIALVVVVLIRRGDAGSAEPSASTSGSNDGPVSPGSSSTASATSSPPSPSSKGGAASGTISRPLDGSTAGVEAGVLLEGTYIADADATYWLVDHDADGTYTADLPVTRVTATTWSAVDQPIGDPDELPTQVTILLVQADDDCAARLRKAADANDSTIPKLGDGCVVADRVSVSVDRL